MGTHEGLCTVTFPPHVNVAAPRERNPDRPTQTRGGENLSKQGKPTVLEDVPLGKAMKHAFYSDAEVRDSDGNVLAKPSVDVVDRREPAAADRADEAEARNAELEKRLDELEALIELKADRAGRKAGTKAPKTGTPKT